MKRTLKFSILGLLFALCCVFGFFGTSYLGANVNAIENENVEVEETIPTGTFTYEDEEGVLKIEFLNAEELHVKMILLDGTVEEGNLKYTYDKEKKLYTVGAGTEAEEKFTLDLENKIIVKYIEEDTSINDTAKEIGTEIEKWVLLIASILSALGVSGAFVGSFAKWLLGKLKKNNTDLKSTIETLNKTIEALKEAREEHKEAKEMYVKTNDTMNKALEEIKTYHEEQKAKSEEISKTAAEVLTTEGGADNDSI